MRPTVGEYIIQCLFRLRVVSERQENLWSGHSKTLKMYRDLSRPRGSRKWSFHQTPSPGEGKNMCVHNLTNLNGLKKSSLNETITK